MQFFKRLGRWFFQVAVLIDQAALLLIQLFSYVLAGRGDRPNADETISSKVGRNAEQGDWWALFAEKVINTLFFFDPNHCRSRIEWEDVRLER